VCLSLLLAGCYPVTAEDWADAERMCERQGGIAEVRIKEYWIHAECKNGMRFAKRRQDDE